MAADLAGPGYHINRSNLLVLESKADMQKRGEASPDVALESSGTFLGMSDELLLDRIRTQPVTRLKLNRGGSSLSFRVDFADGSRAAWKPARTTRSRFAVYGCTTTLPGSVP